MARRFLLRFLVSSFAACAAFAVAWPALAADDGYARAQALFHERKYSEAIAVLTPYLAINPGNVRARVLRGDSYANLEDNVTALKDYDTAIAGAPKYEYAYVTRCETRLKLDDTTGALDDCNTAIKLDASDALAYEDRADVEFNLENYTAAFADYDHAISLGRLSSYLFAARCDSGRLVGKRDLAATDCEHALTLDPASRLGLWARGRLRLVNTDYAGGITDLNAYIAQKPSESNAAYYYRGFAYNRTGNYRRARDDEQIYVQRKDSDPDGHAELAIAGYNLGDKAGAATEFATALDGYQRLGDTEAVARVDAWIAAMKSGGKVP